MPPVVAPLAGAFAARAAADPSSGSEARIEGGQPPSIPNPSIDCARDGKRRMGDRLPLRSSKFNRNDIQPSMGDHTKSELGAGGHTQLGRSDFARDAGISETGVGDRTSLARGPAANHGDVPTLMGFAKIR